MRFFIDTADIEEIKAAHARGWVDGVTTNPSLVAKTGRPQSEIIKQICEVVKGDVSAEVFSTQSEDIFKEGLGLAKIADNVVVKVPLTEEGLIATKKFSAERIKTNVTLCFSPLQALMAAKAGAYIVSPFVGRLDDISTNGMDLISQIIQIYSNYDMNTQILVASARHPMHILDSALLGADIVTMPFKVMKQLAHHPLTDKGLDQFLKDAQKIPQN